MSECAKSITDEFEGELGVNITLEAAAKIAEIDSLLVTGPKMIGKTAVVEAVEYHKVPAFTTNPLGGSVGDHVLPHTRGTLNDLAAMAAKGDVIKLDIGPDHFITGYFTDDLRIDKVNAFEGRFKTLMNLLELPFRSNPCVVVVAEPNGEWLDEILLALSMNDENLNVADKLFREAQDLYMALETFTPIHNVWGNPELACDELTNLGKQSRKEKAAQAGAVGRSLLSVLSAEI